MKGFSPANLRSENLVPPPSPPSPAGLLPVSSRCRLLVYDDVDVLLETVDVELLRCVDDERRRFRVVFVVLLAPDNSSEVSIELDDSDGRRSSPTCWRPAAVSEVVVFEDLDLVF